MHVDGYESKHQKEQLPLNVNFKTSPSRQVLKHRVLGVTVEEQIKWKTHINNICKTVSKNICPLSQTVSHEAK